MFAALRVTVVVQLRQPGRLKYNEHPRRVDLLQRRLPVPVARGSLLWPPGGPRRSGVVERVLGRVHAERHRVVHASVRVEYEHH